MASSANFGRRLTHVHTPDGAPAGPLYAFARTLLRVLDTLHSTHLAFCVDRPCVRKQQVLGR
jgi:hypothetical protein